MDVGTILGIISFFIAEAEKIFGPGTGEKKKVAVIEVIKKLSELLKVTIPAIILTNIGTIIDIIVFFWNLVGTFKHISPNPVSPTK